MLSEKSLTKLLNIIMVVGIVLILIATFYFKLGFFVFFSYYTLFAAVYFLFYLTILNRGDKTEKILFLILTILSSFILLGFVEFNDHGTIATIMAIMMPYATMSIGSLKIDTKDNPLVEDAKSKSPIVAFIVVIMCLIIMFSTSGFYSLLILVICIISTILMISSIKKFKF